MHYFPRSRTPLASHGQETPRHRGPLRFPWPDRTAVALDVMTSTLCKVRGWRVAVSAMAEEGGVRQISNNRHKSYDP